MESNILHDAQIAAVKQADAAEEEPVNAASDSVLSTACPEAAADHMEETQTIPEDPPLVREENAESGASDDEADPAEEAADTEKNDDAQEKQEAPEEHLLSNKEQAPPVRFDKEAAPEEPVKETEAEEPQIPALPLPGPVSDFRGTVSAFAFSQQGQSHVNKGVPCQDRSSFRFLSDTVVAGAVADGVGSCALSDHGADTAVSAALDYLEQHLGEQLKTPGFVMDAPFMGKLLRGMMQYAYDQVKKKSEELEQLLYSMQSTLTVAVYDGKTLYFAHAGDDGIIALTSQGDYEMVTSRHKGDEASSVYPLQSCSSWQYGMVNDVVGFVMATDGVLDAVVRDETEENRIYYPFLEPAFSTVLRSAEETAAACSDWFAYMQSPGYRAMVTDDLSFVCVVNQMAAQNAVKPVFNMEEWKKKTEEYAARRKAALYPPKQPETQKKAAPPAPENSAPGQNSPRQQPQKAPGQQPQRSVSGNASAPKNGAAQTRRASASDPRQAAPAPSKDAPKSQNSHPGTNRDNLNQFYRYSRKVISGVGGMIVVGSEILVDLASDVVQRARGFVDDELDNRGSRNSTTPPGSGEGGDGGRNKGA